MATPVYGRTIRRIQ